ncbi:MAG: OsmC family protein [Fuerstiella sp.]
MRTLGVDRDVPIGLTSVDLSFAVETSEPDEKIEKLIQLTERYCVVLQTLQQSVTVSSRRS